MKNEKLFWHYTYHNIPLVRLWISEIWVVYMLKLFPGYAMMIEVVFSLCNVSFIKVSAYGGALKRSIFSSLSSANWLPRIFACCQNPNMIKETVIHILCAVPDEPLVLIFISERNPEKKYKLYYIMICSTCEPRYHFHR